MEGLTHYISSYRRIHKDIDNNKDLTDYRRIKIAILSSFTISGIQETLFVKCYNVKVNAEIYVGNYKQYYQEILNKDSGLYRFQPDLIIVFLDTKAILADTYFSPYGISDEERREFADAKTKEFQELIQKLKESTTAKILFHNFEVPLYSPMGILENKQTFGFIELVETINSRLREAYKKDGQVFVYDYNMFCSKIGKQNIVDYTMYYLGDIKLNFQHIPELCGDYLTYIKPIIGMSKKCIVLDLDNTLWGGIIGEDGFEGIKLGPEPEGRPFMEFQQYLFSLYKRGIILAVNSKNNRDEVLKVFKEHPYMVLRKEHFASMQINWNDKASNMKEIAKELNIGLDSMVFIDDDKLNREIIKGSLPEVLVVDMPDSPTLYLKAFMELNDFNTLQLTEEDKKKGQLYAERRRREEYLNAAADITDFLRGLRMVVAIEEANDFSIPRISQLTLKTNQFNMTTRRYQEEQVRNFVKNGKHRVWSVRVEDKFGDNGITGVMIVKQEADTWMIDTFLLSCRVIGRGIEDAMLAYIIEQAKAEGIRTLIGEFVQSKKNAPAMEFYKKNGFSLKNNEESEIWEYDVAKGYTFPDFIKIVRGGK
jgi:FkbH-like protein